MLVNNFFGRQFNSLNDVTVNPRNKDIYFTDTLYGYYQYFRPEPGLKNQVYRLNPNTGALTVVADDFVLPNGKKSGIEQVFDIRIDSWSGTGITFSPDGTYAYVTDTGVSRALFGMNLTQPASMSVTLASLRLPQIAAH